MARNGSTTKWRQVRQAVLIRDNYICFYDGAQATQVDHVWPVAKGGAMYDLNNLVACCFKCNNKKSDKTNVRRPEVNPRHQ